MAQGGICRRCKVEMSSSIKRGERRQLLKGRQCRRLLHRLFNGIQCRRLLKGRQCRT